MQDREPGRRDTVYSADRMRDSLRMSGNGGRMCTYESRRSDLEERGNI